MKRVLALAIFTALLLAAVAAGDVMPPLLRTDHQLASWLTPVSYPGDTMWIHFNDFEVDGAPAWEGWTSADLTAQDANHWQIDDYLAEGLDPSVTGNHAWACNTFEYPTCSPSDTTGGYGNNWYQVLEFTTTWESTAEKAPLRVGVHALCRACAWDGADGAWASAKVGGVDVDPVWTDPPGDGQKDYPTDSYFNFDLTKSAGVDKAIYPVTVRFIFKSDHQGSDEDCEAPANCGILLDNLRVTLNDSLAENHVEDCEPGTPVLWYAVPPEAVGDFAKLHTDLGDDDPCAENSSPQVAFIDDGLVVPGTGGSYCISHCYNPGGTVVNTTGGLAGPEFQLHNEVRSPWFVWPGMFYPGGLLNFDMYQHAPVALNAAGIVAHWKVRSIAHSDTTNPGFAPWRSRSMMYYGGASYEQCSFEIGDLIVPGAQYVQVALGVREIEGLWPGTGDDATPAPYFDNVRVAAFQTVGPMLWAHPAELAQDAFPALGAFDHLNAANNYVRFDMARAKGGSLVPGAAPGDSIVCTVAPLGVGASLTGPPVLYYLVKPNPFFNGARTQPLTGTTSGVPVYNEIGVLVENRWAFDLPDNGLLFPGDVLHYYIQGDQTGAGGNSLALLPADTTDFNRFGLESSYDHVFVVRALPTITGWWFNSFDSTWYPEQPQKLWWNDADDSGAREEWIISLRNLGFIEGVDFDIYETNAPDAGVGNGLGGRATPDQIAMYNRIAYSAGDHAAFTLGTAEPGSDPGDDVGLLESHPASYKLLLTGAHWVSDLNRTAAGQAFLSGFAGVSLVAPETRPLAGSRDALDVYTATPFLVEGVSHWSLHGNCYDDEYDAIVTTGTGFRAAEYLDSDGDPGAFSLAAWVLNDGDVWSMPYDLADILPANDPAHRPASSLATRTLILKGFFGSGSGTPTEIPPRAQFRVHPATPNPFNPRTVIRLDLTDAGHVQAEVFDLRGRLVRTLTDERHPAGSLPLVWNGADDGGRQVAAGVYFYRVRAEGRTVTQKMALLR